MQVQLVLVWLGVMKHLHITALHSHSQPLARRTVAQREDLDESTKAQSPSQTDLKVHRQFMHKH